MENTTSLATTIASCIILSYLHLISFIFYLVMDIDRYENPPKLWDYLQQYLLCVILYVVRRVFVDFSSIGSPGCAEGLWIVFFAYMRFTVSARQSTGLIIIVDCELPMGRTDTGYIFPLSKKTQTPICCFRELVLWKLIVNYKDLSVNWVEIPSVTINIPFK